MQSGKASGSDRAPALSGQVSRVSIPDLLATLEARGRPGVVRFQTPSGTAAVWFGEGQLLDAEMGVLGGEAALFRILALGQGTFEVSYEAVRRSQVIRDTVATLISKRAQRAARWEDLVFGGPGLDEVPVPRDEAEIEADPTLAADDKKLLGLMDGRRTLFEVIDESRLDPVQALEILTRLRRDNHYSTERSSLPPRPEPPRAESTEGAAPVQDEARRTKSLGTLIEPVLPRNSTTTSPPPSGRAPRSASVPPPGSLLGPYRVLFRLSQGARSAVYVCREAEQGSVRELSALKVLARRLDESTLTRFVDAAHETAGLFHPNIVRFLGSGAFEDRPVIASEYIDGCSFAALLRRHPRERPPAWIVAVLFDALRALAAAHEWKERALIHGDLCPRDLLLGVDGVCRVNDFAAAHGERAIDVRELPTDLGKLAYLSPERLRGEPLDPRSDVFSVGTMLYEALTGIELFAGKTLEEVRERVTSLPVAPPSTVGLAPPSVFDAVCLRALEREPDKRFPSARAMLEMLEEAALQHDTLASSSDLGSWVVRTFGQELELRRLSVLDASRRSRGSLRPSNAPSAPPPAAPATTSVAKFPEREASPIDPVPVVAPEESIAIPVRPPGRALQGAVAGAAVVVALVVGTLWARRTLLPPPSPPPAAVQMDERRGSVDSGAAALPVATSELIPPPPSTAPADAAADAKESAPEVVPGGAPGQRAQPTKPPPKAPPRAAPPKRVQALPPRPVTPPPAPPPAPGGASVESPPEASTEVASPAEESSASEAPPPVSPPTESPPAESPPPEAPESPSAPENDLNRYGI